MSAIGGIRLGRRWLLAGGLVASLVAAVLPAPAGATPGLTVGALRLRFAHDPAAGRVLGGITDQGWPIVMAISKNEKQVVGTIAAIALSCSSGQQFTIEDAWAKLHIGPTGAVHTSAVIHPSAANSGTSITGGSHSLRGKLDRRTGNFSGIWRVSLSFTTSTGPDQCDSGSVAVALKL